MTLSLPNIGSLANKRRTTFDEAEAGLDWNERNASSVLQVNDSQVTRETAQEQD